MTTDTSINDLDRIHDELGDHGDTRTTHPRLVCQACDSFVYLTRPRGFDSSVVRAECACSFGDPAREDIPLDWLQIDQYVGSEISLEVESR